jgi:glycosyltransferase involved in cell wall biosynthesis
MLQFYPDHPSGSARLAYDEAILLATQGHEVWVITQDVDGNKPEYSTHKSLHVLRYPSLHLSSYDPRKIWSHQIQTRSSLSQFIKLPVDLIHGHSLLNYAGAIALYDKNVRKCYSMHSPVRMELLAESRGRSVIRRFRHILVGNIAHYVERRCLQRSDIVTVFSEYSHSLVQKIYGRKILNKTRNTPGWVDLSKYNILKDQYSIKTQLGWPTNVPVLFTLRRLVPRMGLDRLLYALKRVASEGLAFQCYLAGGGPLRNDLQELAIKLKITDKVCFLGKIPDELLPRMYAAADVFVLPTAELECFGLIAIEALACGRPVLATPVGAIPEVIGLIEPNWLAESNGVESISRLLVNFLKGNLPCHDPLSLRRFVAQRYSMESALSKLTAYALGESQ